MKSYVSVLFPRIRFPGPFESSWDALLGDLNAPAALGELFVAIKPLEKNWQRGT